MHDDPIIDELHKIREQLLEEHGGLEGYVAHLRTMQEAMKVVSREPRPPIVATRKIS
jgi:hypothetical protein